VTYALRRLGLWDEAIDILLQVLESDPANTGIAYDIIDNLIQSRQWSRLQRFMSDSGERLGDDPVVTSLIAMAQLRGRGDIVAARERLDRIPPSREEYYFMVSTELPWYERDYAGVVAVWDRPEIRGFESLAGYTAYRELYLGEAHQQLGDRGRATRFIQQGVEQLSDLDRDGPRLNVAYDLATLSELLALSGEFERAVATAEEALDLVPLEDDHVAGPWVATALSKVLALAGERDRALEMLEEIIDRPAGPTRWELYLDPRWDFFRDDERFNDLIRPHNIEQSKND
jgi:tetratricopeptide (TPR) repeat protein